MSISAPVREQMFLVIDEDGRWARCPGCGSPMVAPDRETRGYIFNPCRTAWCLDCEHRTECDFATTKADRRWLIQWGEEP